MTNDIYVFKYRRITSKFKKWNTVKIIGHQWDKTQNKMLIYYPDGGIEEIARWTDCECKLGQEWVLFTKSKMSKEAGLSLS